MSLSGGATPWGECSRCGFRYPLSELVPDGQMPGLLVDAACRDEKHPLEKPFRLRPERHTMPAPELSKPPDEGTPAPALTFDAQGRLV